jgi:hypothetical protein
MSAVTMCKVYDDGFKLFSEVPAREVMQHKLCGWHEYNREVFFRIPKLNYKAKECRGHVSAPDYIGKVVYLTPYIRITLGWVKE